MSTHLQKLRIHDTDDFLGLVPYLLGYQPRERLVLVTVVDGRLALTTAMPLGMFHDPEGARESLACTIDQFDRPLVLVAAWTSDEELAEEVLAMAEVWIGPEALLDSVVVTPRRWWSRGSSGRGGLTDRLAHGQAAAQAVLAGLTTVATRGEAVAVVDGPTEGDRELFQRLLAEPEGSSLEALAAVRLAKRLARGPLDEACAEDLARLALACRPIEVRDALWLAMDTRHGAEHLALWTEVVRRTPEEFALTPVLLLGCAAWVSGSGAMLVACTERALRLDPTSSLAHLLGELNRQAVPPRVWEDARASCIFGLPGEPVLPVLAG